MSTSYNDSCVFVNDSWQRAARGMTMEESTKTRQRLSLTLAWPRMQAQTCSDEWLEFQKHMHRQANSISLFHNPLTFRGLLLNRSMRSCRLQTFRENASAETRMAGVSGNRDLQVSASRELLSDAPDVATIRV